MKRFKMADPSATEVYWFGEEDEGEDRDWIRVRSSISKQEANQILLTAPREDRDLEEIFSFMDRFFERVIVAWSLLDEQGREVAPTLENFRQMDASMAAPVQEKLMQHFNKLLGREVEKVEGESSS